jgi:hypothetical protein
MGEQYAKYKDVSLFLAKANRGREVLPKESFSGVGRLESH